LSYSLTPDRVHAFQYLEGKQEPGASFRLLLCASALRKCNLPPGQDRLRALVLATRSLNRAYQRQLDIQNILLSQEDLDALYDKVLADMLAESFRALWYFLSVDGRLP